MALRESKWFIVDNCSKHPSGKMGLHFGQFSSSLRLLQSTVNPIRRCNLKLSCNMESGKMGARDAERSGGRRKKSWQKKISSPRCPVSLSPSSTPTTNLRRLQGRDVSEPLLVAIIAAQCRNHGQCRPVTLSVELDRCHERLHFAAWHKPKVYVMNSIHQ